MATNETELLSDATQSSGHNTAIAIAHRLAFTQGHAWAQCLTVEEAQLAYSAGSREAISSRAAQRLMGSSGCTGILSPFFTEGGVIVHTSGSGRLHWEIRPLPRDEAVCYLTVACPVYGDVVEASVESTGLKHWVLKTERFRPQHAHELSAALKCVAEVLRLKSTLVDQASRELTALAAENAISRLRYEVYRIAGSSGSVAFVEDDSFPLRWVRLNLGGEILTVEADHAEVVLPMLGVRPNRTDLKNSEEKWDKLVRFAFSL